MNSSHRVGRIVSHRARRLGKLLLACTILALLVGCPSSPRRRPTVSENDNDATSNPSSDTSLTPALDSLAQLDSTPASTGLAELTYQLNRWAQSRPAMDSVRPDAMVEGLPRRLRELVGADDLERKNFDTHDARYVQETSWLRDIGQWVSRAPVNAQLEQWLRKREPRLDTEQIENLLLAERLFDWTIRNIQLDPLLPDASDAAAGPTGGANKAGATQLPPYVAGIPGPGYQREPWQILLHGHGDAWERARVFLLLARQQEIDVAMLAVFDVKVSPRPRPWLPAVLVGEQLFLFDTTLGLVVPAADGGVGIATLQDVRSSPERLTSLDLSEQDRYPVRPTDLEHLIALIDASPPSLSGRHALLENQLTGKHRMVLTTNPSTLAERIRKSPGIQRVSLWTIPWESRVFAMVLARASGPDLPPELRPRLLEEAFFAEMHPLVLGRMRHLRGQFANQDTETGAKGYYLQARLPDEVINRLQQDEEAQKRVGLIRDRFESDNAWGAKLAMAQIASREAKTTASLWLGLVHYETGQWETAGEWFKNRLLDLQQPVRWIPSARYNLARVREATGDWKGASEIYRADDSPQRYGNQLRARLYAPSSTTP